MDVKTNPQYRDPQDSVLANLKKSINQLRFQKRPRDKGMIPSVYGVQWTTLIQGASVYESHLE